MFIFKARILKFIDINMEVYNISNISVQYLKYLGKKIHWNIGDTNTGVCKTFLCYPVQALLSPLFNTVPI